MSSPTDLDEFIKFEWDFLSIKIEPEKLARALQRFVIQGSIVNSVSISDLVIKVPPIDSQEQADWDAAVSKAGASDSMLRSPPPLGEVPYGEISALRLLQGGTKFFDAIYYLALAVPSRPTPIRSRDPPVEVKFQSIAEDVFIAYFCILTQARALSGEVRMGKFITSVLGRNDAPEDIAGRLASFGLEKIDPSWVKFVDMSSLSKVAENRLALGVAGYRLPNAVIYDVPNLINDPGNEFSAHDFAELARDAKIARSAIEYLIRKGALWNIHPSTRSPQFGTIIKSLNQCCSDLLTFLYTKEKLEIMVKEKVIYEAPNRNPQARAWRFWTNKLMDDAVGKEDHVFRRSA
jgi:hypothetical protein